MSRIGAPANTESGSLSEFDLIKRYFRGRGVARPQTRLGIGDDCALLAPDPGYELALTSDTLVEGVHFFPDVSPADLGYKSLAVSLSDLAATGAEPMWCVLSLTLPDADAHWLQAFCDGFFALAGRYSVELVGGDTTRGPLSISLQAIGRVRPGRALLRSGARVGDRIYVTGELGDAAYAVKSRQGLLSHSDSAAVRLDRPVPRVEAGALIANYATACIDISDGLVADLGHLLEAGGVGAGIEFSRLPLSALMTAHIAGGGDMGLPLCGGDDYELCFTVPVESAGPMEEKMKLAGQRCTCIGCIEASPGLRIAGVGDGFDGEAGGYEHFS